MDAGIVDEDVEPAEFPFRRFHRIRPVDCSCGIEMHIYRAHAGGILRELARKVATEVIQEIGEDNLGASRYEHSCFAGADAARRSGDDCDFPDKGSSHRCYGLARPGFPNESLMA